MPFSTPPSGDLPTPWTITHGPRRLVQSYVDGTAWRFTLERDGMERSLIVAISRHALEPSEPEDMPVETRAAVATNGRSEAARVAQLDDPTTCILLGRHGYLPPPPALIRLSRG